MARPPSNAIRVDKEKEPYLYTICKQLEKDGISFWKNGSEITSALIKLGQRGQFLIETNYLDPVWKPVTRIPELRDAKLIRVPNGRKVFETPWGKKVSYFSFKEISGEKNKT